jgi:hypothetical protein
MASTAITPQPDNDLNSDQIRKVVEHHYFQALVDQRVREQMGIQLEQYKKRMVAPALVGLAVAGWLGYTNISDLKRLKDDAETNIKTAEARITEVRRAVEDKSAQIDQMQHDSHAKLEQVGQDTATIKANLAACGKSRIFKRN